MLKVENLCYNYGSTHGRFNGLSSIHLLLHKGQRAILMGESGCGKSTLLKCLAGLVDLNEGGIWLGDQQLLGPAWNLVPNHKEIKLVDQQNDLLDFHTVLENVLLKLGTYHEAYRLKRAGQLLSYFGLTDVQHQKASLLSAGQRQRLSIVRALAILPSLLLLDEPFSNLDHALKNKTLAYLNREVLRKNLSYIMVTHQPEDALKNGDVIWIMKNGKVIQKGKSLEVYYRPKSLYTASLLGDYSLLPGHMNISELNFHTLGKNIFIRPTEKQKIHALAKAHVFQKEVVYNYGFMSQQIWKKDKYLLKETL